MALLILFIAVYFSIFVSSLDTRISQTHHLSGDPSLRRSPSKRFFLLPKYLLRHSKASEYSQHSPVQTDSRPQPEHPLKAHVDSKQLTSQTVLTPLLGQLPVRPGRQEVLADKLAQSQLLIQPELEDLEEQYVLTDSLASENTISRPCYFSPVQCLLNIPEERINNLVDFVLPVAAVHEANQKKLAEEELANRKKIRSTENRARLESIRKAANGLFGAQMAAQDKMLDLAAETEEEEEPDTSLTRLPPLRTRLGGSMGPNGFGLLPSASGMNNGGQTSARSLAKMFLTQRHATRLRPFMVGANVSQSRSEPRSSWMQLDD